LVQILNLIGPYLQPMFFGIFADGKNDLLIRMETLLFKTMLAIVSAVVIPVHRILQIVARVLRGYLLAGLAQERLAPGSKGAVDSSANHQDMLVLKTGGNFLNQSLNAAMNRGSGSFASLPHSLGCGLLRGDQIVRRRGETQRVAGGVCQDQKINGAPRAASASVAEAMREHSFADPGIKVVAIVLLRQELRENGGRHRPLAAGIVLEAVGETLHKDQAVMMSVAESGTFQVNSTDS
jgi:hypothetical protein